MKLARKLVALSMALLMLASSCLVASASASVSMSASTSFSVVSGVDYAKYRVYGSQSGHSENCTVLEFNPNDGYIPMAFSAGAGSCQVLSTQYNTAVNKYGYEVAGVINGSYFDMATGTLTGILVSNGKVSCADIGYTYGNILDVVAFGKDGSMNVVTSQLAYRLFINGTEVPDALRFINKLQSSDGWRTDAIYYYDTSCGTVADSSTTGYEVICQKINSSDLEIGGKMQAKVVEVKSGTSGTKFESDTGIVSDKFVLSTPKNSSYASYLSSLTVGDTVEITVQETVEASREIMENANSVITNVGWLVKDGVDQTDYNSYIGEHSVTGTYARWTAFGQKADGTYVFFTSEGGDTGNSSRSLTLKDVAAAMIKLGCKNVIRMDGGGSSAMYVSNTGSGSAGYVQSSSRSVADCILIVKKSSVGGVKKSSLSAAIDAASKISHNNYSEETLSQLRDAYETARGVLANASATEEQVESATTTLNNLVKQTNSKFFVTHFNNAGVEGAGVIMTQSYSGASWALHLQFTPTADGAAFELTAISDGTDAGDGTPLAIPSGGFVYCINYGNDYPTLGLGDVDYTSDACNATMAQALTWKVGDKFVFRGFNANNTSYIPTATPNVNWYADEYICTATVEVYPASASSANVTDGVYINKFNESIRAGDSTIFTPAFNGGSITADAANHRYTTNIICEKNSSGQYIVKSVEKCNGITSTINLASNQILIAVHSEALEVYGSVINENTAMNAKVGQVVEFYGINVGDTYLSAAPYVRFVGEGTVTPPESSDEPSSEEPSDESSSEVPSDEPSEDPSDEPSQEPLKDPDADEDGDGIPDRYGAVKGEDGNYTFDNAYGFTFNIDDVNGTIDGEDATIITNSVAYEACNPNWAISVVLSPTGNANEYSVTSVIQGDGNVPSVSFENGTIIMVVHSADSKPEGVDWTGAPATFPNWQSKVASLALKEGDIVNFASDKTTVYVPYLVVEVKNLGDVNLDGAVDQYDYLLLKRYYFGTYPLNSDEKSRADVNEDGIVDQYDYLLLKRVYFGTYTIG